MTEEKEKQELNFLMSRNSILNAQLDNERRKNALNEHKLVEYEQKISVFNSLPWYRKITFKF